MLEVSNNSLTTFRTCPKKWQWYYIEGLKPRKTISSLTLGNIIHEAFDRYYRGETFADIVKWIEQIYHKEIALLPPEEQEQAYLDSKTALGMFLNFPFQNMKFEKIESEKEFKVPISKNTTYIGRVDGLVLHLGKWFIREVKTTGETQSMFRNRAGVSSQATGYVWAIQHLGTPITGVLYDAIRKPRLFKKQTEDMYQFGDRIYLDYCDKQKHDSYFYRFTSYRSPTDIELWLTDTKSTTRQLRRCIKENDFPRNTGSCWSYNSECPYRRICFEKKPDTMVIELLFEQRGGSDVRRQVSEEGNSNGNVGGGDSEDAFVPRQ